MKRKETNVAPKAKPAPGFYDNTQVGRVGFKPLRHKDGSTLKDIEYFELLGRKAIDMDNKNPYKNIPTDYGADVDRQVIQFAKNVVEEIDNGTPREDIEIMISRSIDLNA